VGPAASGRIYQSVATCEQRGVIRPSGPEAVSEGVLCEINHRSFFSVVAFGWLLSHDKA